ncbi:MAG: glycosyltransferase family 2 protein [Candidatus Tectomicrobia bacterium]|uniref:Glycosyltransferase family 2 protein n=1 Tax=Tectimicrobiota bacterium TaxID=2528274 RepID=A0A932GSI4_UNCTE|nr:glycosyltransferase family 2 protein [Candidatus Tectomicrobia bacterium]
MEKLSATVIAYNEGSRIARCLESLLWADEIVVVDAFSQDDTVEVCRRYTDKVLRRDWQGYGRQKNYSCEQASHHWILNLDADETVSAELKEEIQQTLGGEPDHSVYRMPRRNYFAGRWIRRCGWYPDYTMRLFDRRRARFNERMVHESVSVSGPVGTLQGVIEHHTYESLSDYIERLNRYSSLAAEELIREGKSVGSHRLYLDPLGAFLKTYVLRLGFLEGELGLSIALGTAYYTFAKYFKARRPAAQGREKA